MSSLGVVTISNPQRGINHRTIDQDRQCSCVTIDKCTLSLKLFYRLLEWLDAAFLIDIAQSLAKHRQPVLKHNPPHLRIQSRFKVGKTGSDERVGRDSFTARFE